MLDTGAGQISGTPVTTTAPHDSVHPKYSTTTIHQREGANVRTVQSKSAVRLAGSPLSTTPGHVGAPISTHMTHAGRLYKQQEWWLQHTQDMRNILKHLTLTCQCGTQHIAPLWVTGIDMLSLFELKTEGAGTVLPISPSLILQHTWDGDIAHLHGGHLTKLQTNNPPEHRHPKP